MSSMLLLRFVASSARHMDSKSARNMCSSLALLSGSCAMMNSTQCGVQERQQTRSTTPTRFGRSVRSIHDFSFADRAATDDSLASIKNKDDRDDCPICKKYSQGPCGALFQQWLECTDAHPGVNPETKEDWHLSKCLHVAKPLAECLQKHEQFYEKQSVYESEDDSNADSEADLKRAWEEVIRQVESSSRPQRPFPTMIAPELQIRPSTGTGMVALHFHYNKSPLVMVFVKDDSTGEILAAGSHHDLWEWHEGYGILRLALSSNMKSVTVYALYEPSSDSAEEVIFCHTERVPTL